MKNWIGRARISHRSVLDFPPLRPPIVLHKRYLVNGADLSGKFGALSHVAQNVFVHGMRRGDNGLAEVPIRRVRPHQGSIVVGGKKMNDTEGIQDMAMGMQWK